LLKDIESIVEIFNRHITQECEICRGNAFFCELCSDEEVGDLMEIFTDFFEKFFSREYTHLVIMLLFVKVV